MSTNARNPTARERRQASTSVSDLFPPRRVSLCRLKTRRNGSSVSSMGERFAATSTLGNFEPPGFAPLTFCKPPLRVSRLLNTYRDASAQVCSRTSSTTARENERVSKPTNHRRITDARFCSRKSAPVFLCRILQFIGTQGVPYQTYHNF